MWKMSSNIKIIIFSARLEALFCQTPATGAITGPLLYMAASKICSHFQM